MPHLAATTPIMDAAAALGLEIQGRRTRCFNSAAHQGGDDAHPSLTFFPDSNRFQCFSCGAKGDVIDLVKAVKEYDFKAAVEWIQSIGGVPIPGNKTATPSAVRHRRTPDKLAQEVYAELFKNTYGIGPEMPAGKYLARRGICLGVVNELGATQVGDPDEVWSILTQKFDFDRLRSAGLVSRSDKFLFAHHRLLFFYHDNWQRVYLQARDIDGDAECKELSLAGLHSPVPYNADLLRTPQERVYLCEGCVDTLSAIQMGLRAVGVPGVLGFRKEWFDLFRDVGHVSLVFDNDEAGLKQAAELRAQFRLRKIKADAYHPDGVKDMNDLLLHNLGVLHE